MGLLVDVVGVLAVVMKSRAPATCLLESLFWLRSIPAGELIHIILPVGRRRRRLGRLIGLLIWPARPLVAAYQRAGRPSLARPIDLIRSWESRQFKDQLNC